MTLSVGLGVLQRLLVPRSEEPLLAQVAAGGARFRNVVFTENRRVMVSAGDGGKTLRLHECFRNAPPAVLRAIGRVLSSRSEKTRAIAKSMIVDYLRENPPLTARPRGRRIPPGDRADIERLEREFDLINEEYFGGSLPRVPISLSGRMRRRNGHFCSHPPEIVISRALCQNAESGEAEKTLRHEIIHLWQHHEGRKPGHGHDFRRWAEKLGIHPRATRDVTWKCEAA